MRWPEHVARHWWETQKEKDHWEDQDVDWWTILKWTLESWNGMVWTGLIWLRIGTSGGLNAGKFLSGCTIGGSSRRAQLREQVSK
jgi:hypothetical protein